MSVRVLLWFFVLMWSVPTLSVASPLNYRVDEIAVQAVSLREDLAALFATEGTGEVLRTVRARAEQGIDLSALRARVFEANQGQPERLKVPIHPKALRQVEFANQMLLESGIDFYVFEPELDSALPPPDHVSESQAQSYKRWQRTRSIVAPLIGFAATAAESLSMASFGRAFAQLGLELQFSMFSKHWAKLWAAEKPLLQIPELQAAENARFRVKLNGLIRQINALTAPAHVIERSHLYNYLVNWGCTMTLAAGGMLGAYIGGESNVTFDVARIIADSWVINTAFFGAFGLSQIALSKLAVRGEISELLRFQAETVSVKWNLLWRALSFVPGLKEVSLGMQLGFGALISAPLLGKVAGATAYARETRRLFEKAEPQEGALCQRALAGVYGAMAFDRKQSASSAAKSLWQWLWRKS